MEISARVWRAKDDTDTRVSFTQFMRDSTDEYRFLLDCRPRNTVTVRKDNWVPNIAEAIEFVAARPQCSKINGRDRYHNMGIDPESE